MFKINVVFEMVIVVSDIVYMCLRLNKLMD